MINLKENTLNSYLSTAPNFDCASPRSGIWNNFAKLRKFQLIFRIFDPKILPF
jgi:hypothetical protein